MGCLKFYATKHANFLFLLSHLIAAPSSMASLFVYIFLSKFVRVQSKIKVFVKVKKYHSSFSTSNLIFSIFSKCHRYKGIEGN